MSRYGRLISLVRAGALLMVFGNALVTALQFEDSSWKYMVFIFPANMGQGIVYPGLLFTGLATFQHSGEGRKRELRPPLNVLCDHSISIMAKLILCATDHAVSASVTYLVRSIGSVIGVAMTSSIVQTTLSVRLPDILGDIPDKARVSSSFFLPFLIKVREFSEAGKEPLP